MKFWTNILKNVINYQLSNIDEEDKEKPFQKKIEENRWNQIRKTSDRLFAHSVWGKADPTLDKVLNANDLKAAKREFEKRGLDTDYLIK